MEFYPGFDIESREKDMEFVYGPDVFGPKPEKRTLEAIRSSLQDPSCTGPEILYSIVMDVGRKQDHTAITERNLLYGAVTYAKGTLGKEPVRSQGHIHAISPSCQSSTCEVYEIWDGEAFIYMQEYGKDDAGNCYAVHAKAGEVVIVPPGWVHATINANVEKSLTFGAWCVRDFGFDYEEVRAHHGIAYFPVVEAGNITWEINPAYKNAKLHVIERAALFHLKFEGIHPFVDGNGRTGRLILNLMLMQGGYPPVNVKFADRRRYYEVFDSYYRDGDSWPMIEMTGEYVKERLAAYLRCVA